MAWTDLEFDFGSILTSSKMTNLQANFQAMADGDSGAPELSLAALQGGAWGDGDPSEYSTSSSSYVEQFTAWYYNHGTATTLNWRVALKIGTNGPTELQLTANGNIAYQSHNTFTYSTYTGTIDLTGQGTGWKSLLVELRNTTGTAYMDELYWYIS